MFRKEFLEKALASKDQRQQLDHLLRVTAPHERLLLAGVGVLLLALAVWAFFGSITLGLRLEGVLIEPGDRYEVMAAEPGHLVEVLVVPGTRAEAGDAIARQTAPGLEREAEAQRERVELLETEIRQAGGGGGLRSVLDTAVAALLEIEARRSARELIVSQVAGEIMTLRSSPGDYLPAGAAVAQLRAAGDEPLQAVLRVDSQAAERVHPGMRAAVEIERPDGVTREWNGEVAAVTPGPLPDWLAALQPAVSESLHGVDVVLEDGGDLSLPDGTPRQVRIVLGRQPPIALLGLGRSSP